MNCLKEVVAIYGGWMIAHYTASNLYVELCTPHTFIGFVTSPLMINTPQCTGLRWVVTQGSSTISNMWTVAGVWAMKHVRFQ